MLDAAGGAGGVLPPASGAPPPSSLMTSRLICWNADTELKRAVVALVTAAEFDCYRRSGFRSDAAAFRRLPTVGRSIHCHHAAFGDRRDVFAVGCPR